MRRSITLAALAVASLAGSVCADVMTWSPFVIRSVSGATTPVSITDLGGVVTTQIDEGNEKTGYGTTYFNGMSISSLGSVSYRRIDNGDKDPYLNIWITDGTNRAVIAPMPNMAVGGNYTSNDPNGLDIQSSGFNIHETDIAALGWLGITGWKIGGQAVLHADDTPVLVSELLSSLTIFGNTTYGGGGAAKAGTGVNLVFGDSQGNFSQPMPYQIANVSAQAVPLPASAVGGLVLLGLGLVRRNVGRARTA